MIETKAQNQLLANHKRVENNKTNNAQAHLMTPENRFEKLFLRKGNDIPQNGKYNTERGENKSDRRQIKNEWSRCGDDGGKIGIE